MKHGIAVLALVATLGAGAASWAQETPPEAPPEGATPAPPPAPAEDDDSMTGNVQFFIGQAYLTDFFAPLDEPASFGFEVDFAPKKAPVHVALGMNFAGQTKRVSGTYFDQTGKVGAGFLEFSVGFVWLPVKRSVVRPYLGAGVVREFAFVGSGSDYWVDGDADTSFGFYGNAGIYFKVGPAFNIGIDGRFVRGTTITLAGIEGDVDYNQVSLLLGFSWGN
jgi:hypothetical protein